MDQTLGKPYKHSSKHDLDYYYYYPERSKGMSFFAFVFSVFIYTSVFYVLDISPSTLFSNTKFWFFISNTLIIIIAADYGAFSSSKRKQLDSFYDELAAAQRVTRPGAPSWHTVPVVQHEPSTEPVGYEANNEESIKEKRVIVVEKVRNDNGAEGKELVVFEGHRPSETWEETCNEAGETEDQRTDNHENEPCDDKPLLSNEEDDHIYKENDGLVIKVADEGVDDDDDKVDEGLKEEEVDELSALSDEELNKRVEEFILKLKRQIRLQGVRDFR